MVDLTFLETISAFGFGGRCVVEVNCAAVLLNIYYYSEF